MKQTVKTWLGSFFLMIGFLVSFSCAQVKVSADLTGDTILTPSEVEAAKQHVEAAVHGKKSEHQKVLAIRDYMAKDAEYKLHQSSMETFLQTKKGNCNAFARTFYALAKLAELEVTIEYGNNHAFNAVKINQKWYCIDVCWYAVPEITFSDGKKSVKVKSHLPEWSLVSYKTFLENDEHGSHDPLKSPENNPGYDRAARYQWLKENCVHNDLKEKEKRLLGSSHLFHDWKMIVGICLGSIFAFALLLKFLRG